MNRHELATMQGRLSPREGGLFQSFPATQWREEFARAAECGLQRIEWIIDDPDWESNPLMTDAGRIEIAGLSRRTGVKVRSACADLFIPRPLHSAPAAEQRARETALKQMIAAAGAAGLEHMDIPFVDASAIGTAAAFETVVSVFRQAAPLAVRAGLKLCLETSLEPAAFRDLLERIGHDSVGANHDIGNSASLGYGAKDEFAAVGRWISCVHIKDRVRGGGTVPLGTGSADFAATFAELRACAYKGHFVLQIARGTEGDEVAWIKKNTAYARGLIGRLEAEHGSRAQG
ncbi:MAG: sugar phosphate isomerase/epimerase family protein [Elusimicrobiota bacterium]